MNCSPIFGQPFGTGTGSKGCGIGGHCFGKDFDGDFTPEFGVPRMPHFSHTAFAQEAEDLVVAKLGAELHWLNKTTGGKSGQSKSHIDGWGTIRGGEIPADFRTRNWEQFSGVEQVILTETGSKNRLYDTD